MDVAQIRLQNLRHLTEDLERGPPRRRQKDVALELDMSASFLSQLLGGKKMGDEVARKIEGARGLSRGWMDQPQWLAGGVREPEVDPPYLSQLVRNDAATLAASTQLVRLAHDSLGVAFDPENVEDAELVLLACSWLQARNERSLTVDNVVDFTKLLRTRKQSHGEPERGSSTGSTGSGAGGESQPSKAG